MKNNCKSVRPEESKIALGKWQDIEYHLFIFFVGEMQTIFSYDRLKFIYSEDKEYPKYIGHFLLESLIRR